MRELRLKGQGLTALPRAVFDHADTLELLDVSGNALSELPPDLHRFKRLRILFASNNRFTELPRVLGECPALEMVGFKANAIAHVPAEALPQPLRWLILTDNAIATLPDSLGQRPRLQKLMLAGNRLATLPDSLRQAPALELLRIAANQFQRLPDWLPALPRLAWLAWGGNPLTAQPEARALAAASARAIPAEALALGERLGEGASGVIRAATWQHAGAHQAVAVKQFKGRVTSDGWPRSEMAAALAAGAHESLVPVLGPVQAGAGPRAQEGGVASGADHDADDGAHALVLARLPPGTRALAGPPSFDSCTRDVYPPGLRLQASEALALARQVAGAMARLHARGLVHGDLYAHNLLRCGPRAWLSDLGAAAFLPPAQPALHPALRALDVRAFGVLLDEWQARTAPAAPPPLAALRARCSAPADQIDIGFAEIEVMLS
ncbi:leucine-rich repeat-containing protein kinase family protein [Ottowia oryzae]|uniref:Protein kinase n=1 Tax=Ottowia oryzae TaxID=2109914 RepID=A0A2S0MCD7_9BURK|nr:leucine-rich repeat-containing protein kinase family protein [Ottowia oryzae]AVO33554.1 protein kinase [Ottowia oryzae]